MAEHGRRARRRKRVDENEIDDDSGLDSGVDPGDDNQVDYFVGDQFEEVPIEGRNKYSSYVDRFEDILKEYGISEEEEFSYSLHKYDSDESETKRFIDKWRGIPRPPDEDEIGKKHGGGRYMMVCTLHRKGRSWVRNFRIRIHSRYDIVAEKSRLEAEKPSQLPVQAVPHVESQNGLKEAFTMVKEMLALFLPIIAEGNKGVNREVSPDSQMRVFESMNKVFEKAAMDQIAFIADYRRQVSNLTRTEEETEEPEGEVSEESNTFNNVIKFVGPLIEAYLPKLLGGPEEAKAVAGIIQETNQFKTITKDKSKFRTLVNYLDQKEGTAKTDEALMRLGLRRP